MPSVLAQRTQKHQQVLADVSTIGVYMTPDSISKHAKFKKIIPLKIYF